MKIKCPVCPSDYNIEYSYDELLPHLDTQHTQYAVSMILRDKIFKIHKKIEELEKETVDETFLFLKEIKILKSLLENDK